MSTITILLDPSATFSCAFFTTTYSPAGLALTLSPTLLQWTKSLLALLYATTPLLLSTLIYSTLLHRQHTRLVALETAPAPPSKSDFTRLLAALQPTLSSLAASQNASQEAIDDVRTNLLALIMRLENDVGDVDADLVGITRHINVLRMCLSVHANNLDRARDILGAGLEGDENGLEMGDEVEMFWGGGGVVEEEEKEEEEEEEEEIDVDASDRMVEGWLEACEWPEECEDA